MLRIRLRSKRDINRFKNRLETYSREDDGGIATVEVVMWFPIFIAIFLLCVDLSFLFMAQLRTQDVATEIARRWAVGTIGSETEAKSFALKNGAFGTAKPDVSGFSEDDDNVNVMMSFKMNQISTTGVLGFVGNETMTFKVTRAKEPNP